MAHLAEPYHVPVAFGSHFKLMFPKVVVTLHPYLADILHWHTRPTTAEQTNAFKYVETVSVAPCCIDVHGHVSPTDGRNQIILFFPVVYVSVSCSFVLSTSIPCFRFFILEANGWYRKIGFTQSLLSSSYNNIFNKGFSNNNRSSILMHSTRSPIKNWRDLGLRACAVWPHAWQSVLGRWFRRVRQCKKWPKTDAVWPLGNADIEVSYVPTFSFDAPSLLNFFLFPHTDAIAREVIKGFKTSKSGAIPGCAGTSVPWIKHVFELYLWQQLFLLTATKLLLCLTWWLSSYFHS